MVSQYPAAFDAFPVRADGDTIFAGHVDALQDAVVAIQETLGVNPQGASGSLAERLATGTTLLVTAETPLSAPRAVTFNEAGTVRYLDASDPDDVGRLPLVTIQAAAAAGDFVRVVSQGAVPWPSSGLARGSSLFLGRSGRLMTNQPMNVAYTQIVAYALDADTIYVDPQQPILI
ncbi:hypothetical protein [Kineosporia sp. NBRC 101731]|uniref:hypothetical protein n=1 Tax=Kineosporia sp. NBRC 101731 TaxID=3032199 RepID=UPI0024A38AEE|nr:hypothetical protein [Kineosporia sp. NBRC 101731]GLY32126.1 hypothetical protein Kisp02_54910 [Kineosporia sp. NBRC 101731]